MRLNERGTVIMKPRAMWTIALIAFVTTSCGPTAAELFGRDWQVAVTQCNSLPDTPMLARERECEKLTREVARRYGRQSDPFIESIIAYRMVVAERFDKGELSRTEAEFLSKEFLRRMATEREQMLNARRQANAAQEQAEAAKRAAEAAWGQMLLLQVQPTRAQPPQVITPSRPIQCSTSYHGSQAYTYCQ